MLLLTFQTLSLGCHECLPIFRTSQLWDISHFSFNYNIICTIHSFSSVRRYCWFKILFKVSVNGNILAFPTPEVIKQIKDCYENYFDNDFQRWWGRDGKLWGSKSRWILNQMFDRNQNCKIWRDQHLICCGFDILVWRTLVKDECNEKVKNNPKTATGREGVAGGYHRGGWSLGKVRKIIVF